MVNQTNTSILFSLALLGLFISQTSANIYVEPNHFDLQLIQGCTTTRNLTISNEGTENLNFTIRSYIVSHSEGVTAAFKNEPFSAGNVVSMAHKDNNSKTTSNYIYKQGELIVRFARKANKKLYTRKEKDQLLSSLNAGAVKHEFKIVPGLSVVKLPPGLSVENALKKLKNKAEILYAHPNYEVKALSTFPNDSRFNELWGLHNTGQSGGTPDADIDAPEAWDIGTGSTDIVVAVIDTGVDYTHPDLAANMWVNTGEIPANGIDDDGNGYVDDVYGYDFCNYDGDPMDDHYHGTHCAGTIGAVGNNSQGVAGVNWHVKIMALKFLDAGGSGWTDNAINCVEYSIQMGAKLSSNSWGGGNYDQGLKDAIDAAGQAGMLFVAAADNSGSNNDVNPHYPSSYDCESLIAVMATDKYDNKLSFSCYGPISVDLGAPGSEILSCKPGNSYQYLNGTSMATPHVAGACALLWSMNPLMSNTEVKNILLQTVDETLPGLCVSGGRLNLYNAICQTKVPWIQITPEQGNITPGNSVDISVTFDAMERPPGFYRAEIGIYSNDPCNTAVVPVTMTVNPDVLTATPFENFGSSGTEGGPFAPNCTTYSLKNNGTNEVHWKTIKTEGWFNAEPNEGILQADQTTNVSVCISPDAALLDPNIYTATLKFKNTDSNSVKPRRIAIIVKPADCFTELFYNGENALNGFMLMFGPNGTKAYYEACQKRTDIFPTDPNGGTYVLLEDDDFTEITLINDANVLFYGTRYDHFYIGSNGYITFGQGDVEPAGTLENHFRLPRISGLFTDLNPSNNHCISYKQLDDRVAVTFNEVPLFDNETVKNTFQIEMFFADGGIRITWLNLSNGGGVAGLSDGAGFPPAFFNTSDFSNYSFCWPSGDLNRDYFVNFSDFAVLATHWLEYSCGIPNWCEKADLDFNGIVETEDLSIFADNWLVTED